jgi:hypothetical protein
MLKMFRVVMIVDDNEYGYGTFYDRNEANKVAMEVREMRKIETYVEEV